MREGSNVVRGLPINISAGDGSLESNGVDWGRSKVEHGKV